MYKSYDIVSFINYWRNSSLNLQLVSGHRISKFAELDGIEPQRVK